MKTFKSYMKKQQFQTEREELQKHGFNIKEGRIGGDVVFLITPSHMGVEWTKDNLIYRSSIWSEYKEPINLSYTKFFNWGEKSDIVKEPNSLKGAIARTKLDGSTLICSKHNGEPIIRTRGTFNARKLETGHEIDILNKRYPKAFNNKYINSEEYSVIYEWVSPDNIIVLDYGPDPDIFLTAVIRHEGYKLLSQTEVDQIAKEIGVKRPEEFKFSDIATMLQTIENLKDKEGICLYFGKDGQCIKKVKSAEYLRKHHFKSNLTPKNMLEMYIHYGMPTEEEFLNKIEADFDYENMVTSTPLVQQIIAIKQEIDDIIEDVDKFVEPLKDKPRGESARAIMGRYNKEGYTGLAFRRLDDKEIQPDEYKKMILDMLKS
jgi:hypothetical protein